MIKVLLEMKKLRNREDVFCKIVLVISTYNLFVADFEKQI